MKLRGDITINGVLHRKGSYISGWAIYPFFLIHMGMFGGSGFFMAYGDEAPIYFQFLFGGFAILVYLVFYVTIFGREEVKWMFTNAALGLFGIYTEIDWILSLFNKNANDFTWYVHVIPFLYYVLYTFLIRQAFIDVTNSRGNNNRQKLVNTAYVGLSISVYSYLFFLN